VDAPSLLSLADAKRLSGDLDQAKRAYVALRSRFQTSVEASDATFWLGEMVSSNQKDYADAWHWRFSTTRTCRSGLVSRGFAIGVGRKPPIMKLR
jgi:hypothetical protein